MKLGVLGRTALCLSLWGLCFLAPCAGPQWISWQQVLGSSADDLSRLIFWELRVPRTLMSFAVGVGLSLCGLVLQALTQNVLASPFTLGVSSGAAFGATVCLALGFSAQVGPFSVVSIAGVFGALATMLLVLLLSRREGGTILLLAGVVLSFFFSSLALFFQYLADYSRVALVSRWLMGSMEAATMADVLLLAPVVLLVLLYFWTQRGELDLLSCGRELALARGLDCARLEFRYVLATSTVVGLVVALCGPIGFVGILVPHAARMLLGPGHRGLLLWVVTLGGIFLVLCDTLSRSLIPPFEIPVGIVTALVGGPVFVFVLVSARKSLICQTL